MSESVYREVPLELIDEPAHQLRERIDPASLTELADSMAGEGLHQPIGVRRVAGVDRYEIVWGHRRYLAARLLRWPEIAARVFPVGFDPLLAAVSENLQRTDLTALEEAHALQRFVDRGQPLELVARLFRRSESWCRARLAILGYPPDVQSAIEAKLLTLAVAAVLAQIDHKEYRESLIRDAARTGCTVSTAEVWRAHYLSDRDRLIHNQLVIEQMVERRSAYRLLVACDWCEEETPYDESGSVRLCTDCLKQLLEAKDKAKASGG